MSNSNKINKKDAEQNAKIATLYTEISNFKDSVGKDIKIIKQSINRIEKNHSHQLNDIEEDINSLKESTYKRVSKTEMVIFTSIVSMLVGLAVYLLTI